MKKLFVVTLSALAVALTANAEVYVQGNLGYSKVKTSGDDVSDVNKSTFSPSIAVGYNFGGPRIALDYTYYSNMKYDDYDSWTDQDGNLGTEYSKEKFNINSLGLTAFYDFDLQSDFKPYVGARIALNKIKWSSTVSKYCANRTCSDEPIEGGSMTKFGYGVVVGATYKFTEHLALDVGAEYNILAHDEDAKLKQYGIKAGLRYSF